MRHLLLIGGGPIGVASADIKRFSNHQIERSQLKNKIEFNGQVRMGRYLPSIAYQKAARSVEPVKLKWICPSKRSQ